MTDVNALKPVSGMWFTRKGAVPQPKPQESRLDKVPGGIIRQVQVQEFAD